MPATRCRSYIRLLGEISLGKLALRQDGRFCAVETSSNNVATSPEGGRPKYGVVMEERASMLHVGTSARWIMNPSPFRSPSYSAKTKAICIKPSSANSSPCRGTPLSQRAASKPQASQLPTPRSEPPKGKAKSKRPVSPCPSDDPVLRPSKRARAARVVYTSSDEDES